MVSVVDRCVDILIWPRVRLWHQITVVVRVQPLGWVGAEMENDRPNSRGSKHRTGKWWTRSQGWKMTDQTCYWWNNRDLKFWESKVTPRNP